MHVYVEEAPCPALTSAHSLPLPSYRAFLTPLSSPEKTSSDPLRLITVSHLGNLVLWTISPAMELREERKWATTAVKKCSVFKVARVATGWRVVVGGLGEGSKGEVEGWDVTC